MATAFEQRDNSGTLSRNDRKNKASQPDHRGKCVIDGVEYWISAWIKEGKYGKFFSLAFEKKEDQLQPRTGASDDEIGDDIPF